MPSTGPREQLTPISASSTVREVFDNHPAAARVLAEAGFDACCGGVHTLEEAARMHQVDLDALLRRLRDAAGSAG